MTCGKCGTKLPEGASFCMTCGSAQSLAPAAPVSDKPKVNPWAIVASLLVILVVVLLLLLRQPGDMKIVDKGKPAELRVAAKADPETTMPDDIRAWLNHLQRIEEKKNELSIKQAADMKVFEQMLGVLGPGIGELDPTDPGGESKNADQVTKSKFQDMRPAWEEIIADYQSVPPPKECVPIANDYYAGLSEIPGMIADLEDVLNRVSTSPQEALVKAQSLQNKSFKTVDLSFAQADNRFQAICDQYHTKKWFNIGERSPIFAKTSLPGSN